jgi:hypothetical protein
MVTTRTSRGVVGGQGLDRLALAFDDERVVANAGLVLASTLADRLWIERVVDELLDLGGRPGGARVGCVNSVLPANRMFCDVRPNLRTPTRVGA